MSFPIHSFIYTSDTVSYTFYRPRVKCYESRPLTLTSSKIDFLFRTTFNLHVLVLIVRVDLPN